MPPCLPTYNASRSVGVVSPPWAGLICHTPDSYRHQVLMEYNFTINVREHVLHPSLLG